MFGPGNLCDIPRPLHRDFVEEAEGRDDLTEGAVRDLGLFDQEDLVLSDIPEVYSRGRASEVLSKLGHVADVVCLGMRREVTDAHFLDHSLTEL